MCLIGIAHLPETLGHLTHSDNLELRPCLYTNIGKEVNDALINNEYTPDEAKPIISNLIHSLKLITYKVLPKLPISGNVKFDDLWEEGEPTTIYHDNKKI